MTARRTPYVKDYSKDVKRGRGKGSQEDYNPYFTVNDVPSQALRTRVPLLRFNRIMHVLSHSELIALLLLDWNDSVVEIHEQVALDPVDTIPICAVHKIRHPGIHGLETVMTTDFVATYCNRSDCWAVAYQVKATRGEAEQPRTAEKLFIEEEYWKAKGVQWKLLIATDFNPILSNNLCDIHQLRNLDLTGRALRIAEDFWDEVAPQLDPLGKIAELHVLSERIGQWVLNGYQIVKLLIAKKRRSAFIDKMPIGSMRICDIGERQWN